LRSKEKVGLKKEQRGLGVRQRGGTSGTQGLLFVGELVFVYASLNRVGWREENEKGKGKKFHQ